MEVYVQKDQGPVELIMKEWFSTLVKIKTLINGVIEEILSEKWNTIVQENLQHGIFSQRRMWDIQR